MRGCGSREDYQRNETLGAESSLWTIETEKELMSWSIKAHAQWMFPVDVALGFLTGAALSVCLWVHFVMEDAARRDFSKGPTIFALLLSLFFWWIARKKTVWNYNITSKGGGVEFWEDYFKYTKYVFKGIAILAFVCVIAAISIVPGMIWAIAGVGGMVIITSIKLMSWENEIRVKHFTWDRPQCIFTDRKRGMVVLERRHDPDIPFAENYMYFQVFLPKKRIDEFLALCRKYAPSDVEYDEGHFRE
jgi:hypothetical protein